MPNCGEGKNSSVALFSCAVCVGRIRPMDTEIKIRMATKEDAPALLEIYTPYVLETAVTFEIEPPSLEEFSARVERAFVETTCMLEAQAGVEKAACCGHIFISGIAMSDARFHIEYVLQQKQLSQRFVHTTTQSAASQVFANIN